MKVSKIAGIIAKARHFLELKHLKELCNTNDGLSIPDLL